jgi:hypothetical protein
MNHDSDKLTTALYFLNIHHAFALKNFCHFLPIKTK